MSIRNELLEKILSSISGAGNAAVLSVTGDLVDNSDPINPIVNLDNAYNEKAYIILQSVTTQSISTDQSNPTVLGNWTVLESSGISLQGDSIRNDTGRLLTSMTGTLGLHPQVDGGGGVRLIELTSERSPDGLTYTINNQLRPIYTSNNEETYATKESYLTNYLSGEYVRMLGVADTALSLSQSSATIRDVTVTGPAALWILTEQ